MNDKHRSVRELAVGLSVIVLLGLGAASVLHYGRQLQWAEVALPILAFAGLQTAFYIGTFWARKYKTGNGITLGLAFTCLYGWASGIMILHYGAKWHLLRISGGDQEYRSFSISIAVASGILFGALWLYERKKQSKSM